MSNKLFAAFLYGQNIPGCRYLSGLDVQAILRPLAPGIGFVKIVNRPDSILLLCDPSETEQSIREVFSSRFKCKSVVMDVESLRRMVRAAQRALQSIGHSADPPYRVKTDGAEWEWCLVLCSEQLPPSISMERYLGPASTNAVPARILNSRGLLVRKRRRNSFGTRVMTGAILIEPWERALKRNGIVPNCLTSRTLNQVDRVVRAAGKPDVGGEVGARLVPKHPDAG